MLSAKKYIFFSWVLIIMSVYQQSTNDLMSVYNTEAPLRKGYTSMYNNP